MGLFKGVSLLLWGGANRGVWGAVLGLFKPRGGPPHGTQCQLRKVAGKPVALVKMAFVGLIKESLETEFMIGYHLENFVSSEIGG